MTKVVLVNATRRSASHSSYWHNSYSERNDLYRLIINKLSHKYSYSHQFIILTFSCNRQRQGNSFQFKMLPSFLSPVSVYGLYLRRCFTAAGLSSYTLDVDNETTVHFWAPTNRTAQKPAVVLIHGFGPAAIWQWRLQVQFLAPHFNVYVPDLIFFGGSSSTSSERSETFQAASVGKLLDKLKVEKFKVVGTSYGGMVAYNLAKMFGEERVEKVVIASSGVNMKRSNNVALVQRAELEKIEDLMLPATPQQLRKLMSLSIYKTPQFLPHFLLNDFLHVTSLSVSLFTNNFLLKID